MKKIIPLLIFALLILSSCSGISAAEEIATTYKDAGEIGAVAEITVITGYVLDYTVSYKRLGDESRVEITSPKELAGIKATVKNGGAEIVYDNARAETLLPYIPGFSPVDALDGIFSNLKNDICESYSEEKYEDVNCMVLSYTIPHSAEELEKKIWVDLSNHAVKKAEFFINGTMAMSAKITSLTVYAKPK